MSVPLWQYSLYMRCLVFFKHAISATATITNFYHHLFAHVQFFLVLFEVRECRTLWDEHEQAVCILVTKERMSYQSC